MIAIAPRNDTLLSRLRLFVVALPETNEHLNQRPFGVEVAANIHPLQLGSAPFLALLQRLDSVTFGAEGMPMPRWMYVDGAELSGVIVGLGLEAGSISANARALLEVPADYAGLVPYAVYMALPTFEPGRWFGHNLASIAGLLPDENLKGLGSLIKAVALKLMTARVQIGATQWDSRALFVHTRMGPLDLVTANTPAHGGKPTLTYRAALDDAALKNLARDASGYAPTLAADQWIASDDRDAIVRLQQRIEAGERFAIAGRPRQTSPGILQVPVANRA